MIDGHEDFMGDRNRCPFVPVPSFEAVKVVSQVSALGFGCRTLLASSFSIGMPSTGWKSRRPFIP